MKIFYIIAYDRLIRISFLKLEILIFDVKLKVKLFAFAVNLTLFKFIHVTEFLFDFL